MPKGGRREGAGRPAAAPGEKRKRRAIWASDAEWAAMRKRCPDGMTLSEWLRGLADSETPRPGEFPEPVMGLPPLNLSGFADPAIIPVPLPVTDGDGNVIGEVVAQEDGCVTIRLDDGAIDAVEPSGYGEIAARVSATLREHAGIPQHLLRADVGVPWLDLVPEGRTDGEE